MLISSSPGTSISGQWKVLKMLQNHSYTNETHIMLISSSPGTTERDSYLYYTINISVLINGNDCFTLCLYPHHQLLHDSHYILHHKYFSLMESTKDDTKSFLNEMKPILCISPHHQIIQCMIHIIYNALHHNDIMYFVQANGKVPKMLQN